MPPDEQRERMRCMRAVVERHDAHAWSSQILADVIETSERREAVTLAELAQFGPAVGVA